MIKTEIILLTNNTCLPFQRLNGDYGLDFIELNKLFASKSLAEHGIGFLINIYDLDKLDEQWNPKLLKKLIFDSGGSNLTFLHNLDIRAYNLHDLDHLILSHWHYDHSGALYSILERIEDEIQIICHSDAKFERFFRRADDINKSDLEGKSREDIEPLLSASKIVNQEPIDLDKIEKLNAKIFFPITHYELLNIKGLRIIVSGEIPRKYSIEDFDNFFSLQDGTLEIDKILDDKCLIFEYEDHVVVLLGCCHSGLMSTLDYVKSLTDIPISHIIGGIHMARASEERIRETIEYLRTFQTYDNPLYMFPIHCSGEKIIQEINKIKFPEIKAFNASVGTVFNFTSNF
jgi:7,8-dihydropterin-6-yl-methyl-4-(beta-D-ribofuranosyl)aminobenzene 5'-phosphate synthase